MKLHLVNKLWKVTYKRNRGSEKERGEMFISEGGGKGQTKNESGMELFKCQPFISKPQEIGTTTYVAVFCLLRYIIVLWLKKAYTCLNAVLCNFSSV